MSSYLNFICVALIAFLMGYFCFVIAIAQEMIVETRDERFATSTMDNAKIEEILFLESKYDQIIAEQKITNRLLNAIYEKI